jgi:S1-C subfamily serine protease
VSELFKNVSDALADTVEAASAGVVRVEGRRRLAASGIIWREGVIVAASHAVKRDDEVKVGTPSGEVMRATIAGRDKNTDIAVLRFESDLKPAALAGDHAALRVGHLVLALGRPGESVQATLGVVSAIGSGHMAGLIQTDVVMYPGFSGGPLVDASGKVQGMNTSGFMRGVSAAVSTTHVNRVVDVLLEHGRMKQGFLGVGAQPVRLPQTLAAELGPETGLMLASVESGSSAADAGLYMGDTIVALDGEPTPHLDALLMLLGGDRVGQTVPVKVIRGGQIHEINVTIGEKE